MSRSKSHYNEKLPSTMQHYAEERGIAFEMFSDYHMRLSYDTVAVLDCWTSDKYWVKETNYYHGIIERQGETGYLPSNQKKLYAMLDKIFFAVEIKQEGEAANAQGQSQKTR